MKTRILLACAFLLVIMCRGQEATNLEATNYTLTNGMPTIDPTHAPLPKTITDYTIFGITLVTPFLLAGLKWLRPHIPRRAIPAIAPVLGILLGLLHGWITAQGFSWWTATLSTALGLAATGFREMVDQNVIQPAQTGGEKINELKAKIVEVQQNPKATI